MPARTAARRNHILAPVYEGLLARGKLKKVATTVIMRKLLILAHRLLSDPDFKLTTPQKTAQKPAPEK